MLCNCPKVYCVGTEGICLPHMFDQIVWFHILKTRKLYDLNCISTTSRFKKKKEKKETLTYRPFQFSGQRGKQSFIFFRPNIMIHVTENYSST